MWGFFSPGSPTATPTPNMSRRATPAPQIADVSPQTDNITTQAFTATTPPAIPEMDLSLLNEHMRAEWDKMSPEEQLQKRRLLLLNAQGYTLERNFNIWRNEALIRHLQLDDEPADVTNSPGPPESQPAPQLPSPPSTDTPVQQSPPIMPVGPSESQPAPQLPFPTSMPSPVQLPPPTQLPTTIPELTTDETAGARVEGLASIDYLRHGFNVLMNLDDGQTERGPHWLATVFAWAQLEEIANVKDADLVSFCFFSPMINGLTFYVD